MKKCFKILLGIAIGIVCLSLTAFLVWRFFFDPYRGTDYDFTEARSLEDTLSTEEVRKDMDFVMRMLRERHPAWLEADNANVDLVEQCFQEEYDELINSSTKSYTVLDEWKLIAGFMTLLHDGHSGIYPRYETYQVLDAAKDVEQFGIPLRINGESTDELFGRFLDLFFYETESYAYNRFYDEFMYQKMFLQFCGVNTDGPVTFTYATADGERDITYPWVSSDLIRQDESEDEKEFVSYDIDTDHGIGIFTLRECNYTVEYKLVLQNFFDEVADNAVTDIIVDLRNNGGGNSQVGDAFLNYLAIDGYNGWGGAVRYGNYLSTFEPSYMKVDDSQPKFSGNVYVLTNSQTYSAAMDFTMYILDNDLGCVIGEASGNLPDSYGDVLRFTTPYSRLTFNVSYKRWYRIDRTKAGEVLEPDIPCEPESAMDKAYEIILENR